MEDEDDIDDQNLPECNFNKERCDFLYEVLVIFWDEFISNDQILIEAVLEEFKRDGIHRVTMCLSVLATLLRYAFFI